MVFILDEQNVLETSNYIFCWKIVQFSQKIAHAQLIKVI